MADPVALKWQALKVGNLSLDSKTGCVTTRDFTVRIKNIHFSISEVQ